jgi:hypothetical protein
MTQPNIDESRAGDNAWHWRLGLAFYPDRVDAIEIDSKG